MLQIISIIVALGSIVFAFVIGFRSIRNFAISRKASVFISFQTQAYDKQFLVDQIEIVRKWSWKDYEEYRQKYGPQTNPDAYAKFISVGSFYEGMARLLKKQIIDIDLMPETMAIGVIMFWDKIKSISAQMAKDFQRSEGIKHLEYLYDEVKKQHPMSKA